MDFLPKKAKFNKCFTWLKDFIIQLCDHTGYKFWLCIGKEWYSRHQGPTIIIYHILQKQMGKIKYETKHSSGTELLTLDSGVNVGVRLLIFEKFWRQKKNNRNA